MIDVTAHLGLLKEGKALFRDDIPKELLILEECLSIHSAEYAIKYTHMEQRIEQLEKQCKEQALVINRIKDYASSPHESKNCALNRLQNIISSAQASSSELLQIYASQAQIQALRELLSKCCPGSGCVIKDESDRDAIAHEISVLEEQSRNHA